MFKLRTQGPKGEKTNQRREQVSGMTRLLIGFRKTNGRPTDTGQPIRLAGRLEAKRRASRASRTDQGIDDPADPRWVLAVRTAEQLEGPILTLEKRHKLVRLGLLMGLRPFDTNLIIAIVQDQARRGRPPQDCPGAGEQQLAMVCLPQRRRLWPLTQTRLALISAAMAASLIVIETVMLFIYLI